MVVGKTRGQKSSPIELWVDTQCRCMMGHAVSLHDLFISMLLNVSTMFVKCNLPRRATANSGPPEHEACDSLEGRKTQASQYTLRIGNWVPGKRVRGSGDVAQS